MSKIKVRAVQQEVGNIDGKGNSGFAYVIHPDRYTTIDAKSIVDMCAEHSHVPRAYISASMVAMAECIQTSLLNGSTVEFPDLGFFSITSKSSIETDVAKVGVHQLGKFNIRFRPCKELKQAVQSVHPVLEGIYDIDSVRPNGKKVYRRVHRHRKSSSAPEFFEETDWELGDD